MIPQALGTTLLGLVALTPMPQRGVNPLPGTWFLACTAPPVECLFGIADGCTASCPLETVAYCRFAYCLFGFPKPAFCTCCTGQCP
jgi:hypothetical protein